MEPEEEPGRVLGQQKEMGRVRHEQMGESGEEWNTIVSFAVVTRVFSIARMHAVPHGQHACSTRCCVQVRLHARALLRPHARYS